VRERAEWQRISQRTAPQPVLSAEDECMLLDAALCGDRAATQRIVQSHLRLVWKIASRYERASLAVEDLVSEGVVGLLEALRRFDRARGVRFAAYASWWIRARISQYALANRRAVGVPDTRNARSILREFHEAERRLAQRLSRAPSREELAQEIGVPAGDIGDVRVALNTPDLALDQPLAADCATPEELVLQKHEELCRSAYVRAALDGLSARERTLVSEQYLAEEGRSLSQLGAHFGVSRQRLGQVLSNAREKLKLELIHVA
jgi:RNA polymerase sigma-32 factor